MADAQARGVQSVYVSATPAQNTVQFYRSLGFQLAQPMFPTPYAAEPEDIHMTFHLRAKQGCDGV